MGKKKTVFNSDWCNKFLYPQWSLWLCADNDKHKAMCLACKKSFSLSNMGKQAVESHENGPKHISNVNSINPKHQLSLKESFASKTNAVSTLSTVVTSLQQPLEVTPTDSGQMREFPKKEHVSKYLLTDEVTKAEILWCLKTVMSHSSYRSNSNLPEIFQKMFPDSVIAKKFQLKKDKTAYTLAFGLAPFFKEQLVSDLTSSDVFVVCFDESLNKVIQKGQMDIHVKFWNKGSNQVTNRYLTSVFLGHADAVTLLNSFKKSIPDSRLNDILQVSMDGPNVNHKFHSLLQTELKESPNSRTVVDIGSCGLHIIHGAFKTGHQHTLWNIHKFLYALYNLFKDSPARRADYIRFSKVKIFPVKFCSVRWVESSNAAQKAYDVLPYVKMYVKGAQAEKIEPGTKTYVTVKNMVQDSLIEAKLGFFISVASEVEPFLRKFQDEKPMAPFLFEELHCILRTLMKRFIKPTVIEHSSTATKLMQIDVRSNSNFLPVKQVNVGFAARNSLKQSKESELRKLTFMNDCQKFLLEMTAKLLQRNPLKYKLVRGISCFSPTSFLHSNSLCTTRLEIALDVFIESKHIGPVSADRVKTEFNNFANSEIVKDAMKNFKSEDRLDELYSNLLKGRPEYVNLFGFVKNVLILSHGNATVESGFSINKSLLVENLKEKSVVSLRTIYDAVSCAGGYLNVNITKSMILAARNSHSQYREELKKEQDKRSAAERLVVRKRKTAIELKELQSKKIKIQEELDKKNSSTQC